MLIDCAGRKLDLFRPQVMGIINITPDSFSDGGRHIRLEDAVAAGRRMAEAGAAILDVGGESTRPGAAPVDVNEEIDRVVPVIERLAAETPLPISVDTSKPEVMQAAVAAGAGFVNDVYGLRREGAVEMAADLGVPVCVMHMQGEPRTMQEEPTYRDVVEDVFGFLATRVAECEAAGIPRERIVADPGFGFGKRLRHNLQLLRQLRRFGELGVPLLVGISRKSMIGAVLGDVPPEHRLQGSVAAATLAAWLGAKVLRVHDVAETVEALKVVAAVSEVGTGSGWQWAGSGSVRDFR